MTKGAPTAPLFCIHIRLEKVPSFRKPTPKRSRWLRRVFSGSHFAGAKLLLGDGTLSGGPSGGPASRAAQPPRQRTAKETVG